jgi:NADH:ubiquinone oxidoreductase subunit 2 (subunit N)
MSFGRNVKRLLGYGSAIGGGYIVATWMLQEPASVRLVIIVCFVLHQVNNKWLI